MATLSEELNAVLEQITDTNIKHAKNTEVGSKLRPVYIDSEGNASPTTYILKATVPTNPTFTDTTYEFEQDTANEHQIKVTATYIDDSTGETKKSIKYFTTADTLYKEASESNAGLLSIQQYKRLINIADNATNVIDSTVSNWGFTKNEGTVTSVSITPIDKYGKAGTTRTITASGSLGSYVIEHQDISGKANVSEAMNNLTSVYENGGTTVKFYAIDKKTLLGTAFAKDTTYSNATQSAAGLESATDKTAVDLWSSERTNILSVLAKY